MRIEAYNKTKSKKGESEILNLAKTIDENRNGL